MIAAHPDDEDTELLTVLARGMGAETAYLSLTRGEGGQNLIGDELGPALGVLRTEELLAARELDGAQQFFTRAYDFGYSKSLADTWKFWPADSVLKDVVRIIRQFQPQIIVAVFSGTPRDGHGQHQASGWAAREAFKAAADSTRFPELAAESRPWRTLKLYQSARFASDSGVATLDGGVLDRAVGQSYLQIAMRGRSLHRSQDMGAPQRMGPSTVRVRLVEDLTGAGPEFFAGVDTSLASTLGPEATPEERAEAARIAGRALAPHTVLVGWTRAGAYRLGPPDRSEAAYQRRVWQLGRLDAALSRASGLVVRRHHKYRSRLCQVSGSRCSVSCWNTGTSAIELKSVVMPSSDERRSNLWPQPPARAGSDVYGQCLDHDARLTPPQPSPTTFARRCRARCISGRRARLETDSGAQPREPAPFVALFVVRDSVVQRRDVVFRTVEQATRRGEAAGLRRAPRGGPGEPGGRRLAGRPNRAA